MEIHSCLRAVVAAVAVLAVSNVDASTVFKAIGAQDAATTTTLNTGAASQTVSASKTPAASSAAPAAGKTMPKILVLGAGMSGVMAANTLYEKGFTDVTIIDANDYIGGRIKSGWMGGRAIELGANWIHGTVENPIFDYAVTRKLKLVETNWSSVAMLPADPNSEEEEAAFEEAFEKAEKRAERYLDLGKKDLSVTDALLYEGWSAHTPLENALLYNEFDLEVGPSDQTSFELGMNIPTYAKDDKDMLVVDGKGYNTLASDLLAKNFPNPLKNPKVVLNTMVNKIQYNDKGVTVYAKNLKTKKAVTYNADFVITTFSAGVLRQKAPKLFVPALPEDKLDVIYRIRMTLFLKVFVEVTEKFWKDVTDGAETWVYADATTGNFTSWVDLSQPKLGEAFASPKNGSYLAVAMLGGEIAKRTEKLSPTELKNELVRVLRGMFPKAASRINTKTVASVQLHRWGQDELYSGSWANPPPSFTKEDFAKLAEPVGRVYFSGEHTSAEYFGYVHGAYVAGINTAKQLLERPEFQ